MIVTVGPADFASCHQEGTSPVLDGIAFQRRLERAAFRAGNGKIPVQLFGDFCENRVSAQLGDVEPSICGAWTFGDVRSILPETVSLSLAEGIRAFDRKIAGFARADAVLSGVESRTSSPFGSSGTANLRAASAESIPAERVRDTPGESPLRPWTA